MGRWGRNGVPFVIKVSADWNVEMNSAEQPIPPVSLATISAFETSRWFLLITTTLLKWIRSGIL